MASLGEAKSLGGAGSILVLISGFVFFIPFASPVISLIGWILVLVAVKYIADAVGDDSVFTNMIVSVLLAIVGIIVMFLIVFVSLAQVFPGFAFGDMTPSPGPVMGPEVLITLIVGLLAAWAIYVVSAIFLRRSYDTIATRLNVSMFSTTALLYLIGAITVVILVGFIVIFVAIILQMVAFFSLPEQLPEQAPIPGPPAAPPEPPA